jgi:hypothetical protein
MKHARFPTSPLSRRTFLEAAASLGAATLLPGERGKASGTLPTSDAIRAPDAAWPDATIRVDADADRGPVSHAWAFFGHDEANWAATDRGQALLAELNALSPVPVHLRAHHLLTSLAEGGPPEADLKWSATNVYREDEQGRPVYNWTATDRLFDAYAAHDVTPFVEVGFMPQALATRGIGKAILNGFRMLGIMTGRRLHTESTGAVGLEEVLEAGVREASDIDAMAARNGDVLTALVWNYHGDDMPVPPATVRVRVQNLLSKASPVLLEHYRIDRRHSNPYPVWQAMGRPQDPSEGQLRRLREASTLALAEPPQWIDQTEGEDLVLELEMPRYSLSLLKLSWNEA